MFCPLEGLRIPLHPGKKRIQYTMLQYMCFFKKIAILSLLCTVYSYGPIYPVKYQCCEIGIEPGAVALNNNRLPKQTVPVEFIRTSICVCVFSAVYRCRPSTPSSYIAAAFIEEICRKRKNIIIYILLLEHRNRKEPHFNLSQVLFFLFSSFRGGYVAPLAWRWFVWLTVCVCAHLSLIHI